MANLSRIGFHSAAATSVATTNAVDDLLICCAFRSASATPPTLPAGWTEAITAPANGGGGSNNSCRIATRVATATNEGSGTWTNATAVMVQVWRGQRIAGAVGGIAEDSANATAATINYPAVTLTDTDGGSALVAFGMRTTTGAVAGVATAPTGMTNAGSVPATPYAAGHYQLNRATNWALTTVTPGGTDVKPIGVVMEIRREPPVPTTVTPGVGVADWAGFAPSSVGMVFADLRQEIIDGIVSAQSETHGWNAERVNIPVSAVVRTSDTVVTITLPALASYDITVPETLTVTVPAAAVPYQTAGVVGTPTITIAEVAAAGTTVTPGTGVATWTGLTPAVLTPRLVAPLVGIATWTGFAPTALTPQLRTLGTGLADWLGIAPTVLTPRLLLPSTGIAVWAGLAPAILTPRLILTSTGLATWSGLVPTVIGGQGVTRLTSTGVADWAGLAPAFVAGNNITIPTATGAATWTGFAPSVVAGTSVQPGIGVGTWTGLAPTVVVTQNAMVRPDVGQATWTGLAPSLPRTAVTATGVGTWTGLAPTFVTSNNKVVTPTVGAATWSGFAPTLVTPFRTTTDVGQAVWTGLEPTVRIQAPGRDLVLCMVINSAHAWEAVSESVPRMEAVLGEEDGPTFDAVTDSGYCFAGV